MRSWIRDQGLLLANLGLFVVFFGGMVLTGVQRLQRRSDRARQRPGLLGSTCGTGRLRRGDVRELGERVPADGHVRRAHRVPVPEGILGVQADRRAAAAGRGPPQSAGQAGRAVAGAPRRLGAEALRELARRRCSSCCSWRRSRCTPSAARGLQREQELPHGEPSRSAAGYLGTSQFWFESFQNWQSEFLAVAVDRRRLGLPAPARLRRVEAGRRAARRDRHLIQPGGGRTGNGRPWPLISTR